MYTEECVLVSPPCLDRPSSAGGQRVKLPGSVFVRVFGVNRLAGGEVEYTSRDRNALGFTAYQMHLNPAFDRIVAGLVLEVVQGEVGADLVVDATQQVEIKGRRGPGCVVVGGV